MVSLGCRSHGRSARGARSLGLPNQGFDILAELIELALDGIAFVRPSGQLLAEFIAFLGDHLQLFHLLAELSLFMFGRRQLLAELLADFPGPVVFGFPSGHTTGAAMTLPFGVACRVIAGPRPRLVIEESAVL